MSQSEQLFQRAKYRLVGGVNSPVRSFNGVGGTPVFFQEGKGAYLIDADGKSYIDYVGSWGPLILGHCHPAVTKAVIEAVNKGLTFGAPTEQEIILAEKIHELMPNMEMTRLVSSGTEATMSAIRLARGFTGRNKIIKFIGCYHGHHDALLVSAGSGLLTLGIPSCPGIPNEFIEHTLVANFNDLDSVAKLAESYKDDLAGIILEPVAGNMGCIPPLPGFLKGLREICDHHQALLIFDEVMTGFRVALGGAQAHYQVTPDLTTLGKIIGGGMPVGAFGGHREIMEHLAPIGQVYQAGTLSGNPVAMAAGIATLQEISKEGFYSPILEMTQRLMKGFKDRAKASGIPLAINDAGIMFSLFFTEAETISSFKQVQQCNHELFKQFFHGMLKEGVYLPPSSYEAWFMSSTHLEEEIKLTLEAAEKAFEKFSTPQLAAL